MSASSIVAYVLSNDSDLTGVVPAARIFASPQLPQKTALPAINVWEISGVERLTVAMGETKRFRTDRVQVTVHAKTGAQLRQLLLLVREAVPLSKGRVNGFVVDSILPDIVGPDLSQPEANIFERSHDYLVRWHAVAAVEAFSPSDLANLAAWYRFGKGIFDSGGAVALWADASGHERHLLMDTAARQPTLQADGTVLFDGSADALVALPFGLAQPTTVCLRFKQITWTVTDRIFDGSPTINTGILHQAASSPTIAMHGGAGFPGNITPALGAWASVVAGFNGASSFLKHGANALLTGNAGSSNMDGFTLGAAAGLGNASNIAVAEVAIFSAALTSDEINAMITYLDSVVS